MSRPITWKRLLPIALGVLLHAATAHATVVFSTDFESGLPDEFSSPGATIEPVQDYEGIGHAGNAFAGSFLRYADSTIVDTQLTLTNLPQHDRLTLGFLLAVIDSWDGVERLDVSVDDELIFSNSFNLATEDTSTYGPPPGGLLSASVDLGFSSGTFHGNDRAYDLSLEPVFMDIPHGASSVTITWRVNAVAGSQASYWQGGGDESWAIDNVTVSVANGEPTTTTDTTSTTTTSTTSSTSTTTLVLVWCGDIPQGPTFASIACRLDQWLGRMDEPALGPFQAKLANLLTNARARAAEARALCAAGNSSKAKGRLARVDRAVRQYTRRLMGRVARRRLATELRNEFLDFTDPLREDVQTLRREVRCPDDADS